MLQHRSPPSHSSPHSLLLPLCTFIFLTEGPGICLLTYLLYSISVVLDSFFHSLHMFFPPYCTTKPTLHSVPQYCGHPQVFLMQAMLYLHINTAISSIKPSKMNKTPKTSNETSHKTLPSKYAEGSFHPLCSLPKQKRSWKVEVKT